MDYKTILTALTSDDMDDGILEPAKAFALAHGAHLEALCYGIDHAYPAYHYGTASLEILQQSQDKARDEALEVRRWAADTIESGGVEGTARAVVAGLAGIGDVVADRGRLADVAILTRSRDDDRPQLHEMIVEGALFHAHLPVLFVPRGVPMEPWPRRIVVGWDDGPQALAAIRAALPLLVKAETVYIVVVDPPRHDNARPDPGHDLSQVLSRHGVSAEVVVMPRTLPQISDVLLRQATDNSAGLVVMGAYGHSRFQETVFGGTTRRMLVEAKVPLLLAH